MKAIHVTSEEFQLLKKVVEEYIQDHNLFNLPVDDDGNYYDINLDGNFSTDTFTIQETILIDGIINKLYRLD